MSFVDALPNSNHNPNDLLHCFTEDELEDAHLYHEDNKVYEVRFRKTQKS